jgi:metallo-beta-lactamase family protein
MKIQFLGAARQVTGSCYHLSINGIQLLVDCGMEQGEDSDNESPFSFNPSEIDYVFLTHAHIDHSGMLPRLVKDGFKGRIITSSATADLIKVMLRDSAHLQEKDAEWKTKKAFRQGRDKVYLPLYTVKDAEDTLDYVDRTTYDTMGHLGHGVKYSFLDAGHIMGSASLALWYQDSAQEKKIVFSGDIGKKNNPIIEDPQYAVTADYVIMESTYGDRLHRSLEESVDELAEAIKVTFKRGGNVIMPTFAVGRTQDVLYTLDKLIHEKRLPPIDVFVDSPLAHEATKIYLKHPENFDEEARKTGKITTPGGVKIHFTASVEESQAINRIRSGVVIMAGGGMCEGGRVTHHLKHNLWRPECSIVFTGFQARGTLGRRIVDGASHVHVLGEEVAVRARVYTINGFSAHADKNGLLEWISSFTSNPQVFIVHGEEKVALAFQKTVQEATGFTTIVPRKDDSFNI